MITEYKRRNIIFIFVFSFSFRYIICIDEVQPPLNVYQYLKCSYLRLFWDPLCQIELIFRKENLIEPNKNIYIDIKYKQSNFFNKAFAILRE